MRHERDGARRAADRHVEARDPGVERGAIRTAGSGRFAAGTFNGPGPAAAWTRPACDLVDGEPITPLQHLLVMTDAASGISTELDWTTTNFANVDLSIALHRPPAGDWLGMDARTVLGGLGAAQCFADLYDTAGRIGRSSQSLFVESR